MSITDHRIDRVRIRVHPIKINPAQWRGSELLAFYGFLYFKSSGFHRLLDLRVVGFVLTVCAELNNLTAEVVHAVRIT